MPRGRFGREDSDPRRALMQRRQAQAVQLRRRRREDRLAARRLGSVGAARHHGSGVEEERGGGENAAAAAKASVQSLLAPGKDLPPPQTLQHLESLLLSPSGRSISVQWLEDDPILCRSLVAKLSFCLQGSYMQRSVLTILQELASTSLNNPSFSTDREDSYYGRSPLTWPDICAQDALLMPTLLALEDQEKRQTLRTAALTTLGILVQSPSRQALQFCIHHYAELLQALPHSSYCCAAVLTTDDSTYGMAFFPPPMFHTTAHLVPLLLENDRPVVQDTDHASITVNRVSVNTAWMLQGLSFREEQVIHFLCSDPLLMDSLLQVMERATESNDLELLVPLLQALCNLVTANQGNNVGWFLSSQTLVQALQRLLTNGQLVDALTLAMCLLLDCGVKGHPSTLIAAPALMPLLAQGLRHTRLEWREQAMLALATALRPPMSTDQGVSMALPTMEWTHVHAIVRQSLWPDELAHQRCELLETMGQLMAGHDMDATLAALTVLEWLFGMVPESRRLFESVQGVDRLEELCHRSCQGSRDLENAQSVAARLLDVYWDYSDEEDDDGDVSNEGLAVDSPIVDANGHFSFGLAPGDNAMSQQNDAVFASAPGGHGRGRGRTLPAWMQQG